MIIGKIDYINLIPFELFIKRHNTPYLYNIMNHHKGYPFYINSLFKKRKIKAGFLSSIVAKNYTYLDIGIVAKKEALSVLVCKGENIGDPHSQTSNILAKILNIDGQVVIGDEALKKYFNKGNHCIDLAKQWSDKYNLPFVFALFCVNEKKVFFRKLAKRFKKEKIFIPYYILQKYEDKTKISKKNILKYLKKITYEINTKEKKSIKKFFSLSNNNFKN